MKSQQQIKVNRYRSIFYSFCSNYFFICAKLRILKKWIIRAKKSLRITTEVLTDLIVVK